MTALNKQDLINYFVQGCKTPDQWRIGTEHELFLYDEKTGHRLNFEGTPGIQQILNRFTAQGWQPVFEKEALISAKSPDGMAALTLEPGGQFELSGAPLLTVHETSRELTSYFTQLQEILNNIGAYYQAVGFEPTWTRADVPWMPKGRYGIMKAHMEKRGHLGHDMMLRTCTVQVNLDYSSEKDMVRKFRVAMALQPLVVALFANSPFTEGQPNGFQSYRSHIWQDTDPDRCGFLDFVFDTDMGFERYVDYLLNVPLYFVYRDQTYHNAAGLSFQDFMHGKLPGYPGLMATIADWADQTTVAFPEVRLKKFLEMRGADCGPLPMLQALPAFWVGLLYDETALHAVYDLISSWSVAQMHQLYREVPYEGLYAKMEGESLQTHAQKILNIAEKGLKKRAQFNADGEGEEIYLQPLWEIVHTGKTMADRWLDTRTPEKGR